jgi:hypothetical protein
MNELVKTPTTEVAGLSQSRFAALAQAAKDAAAKERPSLSKISLKSGVISFGGTPVKNNRLDVVVTGASYRNTFYKGRYDPNNIVNPDCFSLSETDDDMVPDPAVLKPQHPTCAGCPRAEWGSDLNGGRGKACKETRRLVLIPGSVLSDENPAEAVKTAEMAILDVPVTSVRNYSNYINILATSIGLPAHSVLTEISVKPDAKTQFKVDFKGIGPVASDAILDAIEARMPEAKRVSLIGYDPVAEEEDEPPLPAGAAPAKKVAKKF